MKDRLLAPVPGIRGAGAISAMSYTSGVALTATSGWLIVQASTQPPVLHLLMAIVGVRAFGLARPVFRYWERLVSHKAALTALADTRRDTYAALVPLTPARLGRRSRSEVLTGVVRDLDDTVMAQVKVTVPAIAAALTSLIAMALAFVVDWRVGLVVLAGTLGMVAVSAVGARMELAGQRAHVAARADVDRMATTASTHLDELRGTGATDLVLAQLREAERALAAAGTAHARARAFSVCASLLVTAAVTVAIALIVASGATGVDGPLAALLVLAPMALAEPWLALPEAAGAWVRARAAADRVETLTSAEPAVAAARATDSGDRAAKDGDAEHRDADGAASGTGTKPPRLALEAVSATWTGDAEHLPATDLRLSPGDRVAITGPSGAGKSTLLAVIARHLDPASGTYTAEDADVMAEPLDQARGRIAVLDDEPHVFASTVRENLKLASPGADDAAIHDALALAGLGDWVKTLPEGLDTMVGTGNRDLSGGERTRLGLARAVLSSRGVLVLDEPVSHLDHDTAVAVLTDVARATQGRSLVMVTHRPEGLDLVDRVVNVRPSEGESDLR